MGTCFSSQMPPSESTPPPTAQVVSLNGDLHKYNLPVFVSRVLQDEAAASSLQSSAILLCNSDLLYYDDYIPALDLDHQLQANQIYFVLPISKLQQRLSSSDMVAWAVKASVAIQNASKNDSHRRKKARISPVLIVAQSLPIVDKDHDAPTTPGPSTKSFAKPQSQPGFSRSASIIKLQKYTSRRAKLAVRSLSSGCPPSTKAPFSNLHPDL